MNKLSLNFDKTNFMIFTNKDKSINDPITIDGAEITRVGETKFWGVMIDENLSWKSHINYTKKKISKIIALLH